MKSNILGLIFMKSIFYSVKCYVLDLIQKYNNININIVILLNKTVFKNLN